MFTTGTKFLIGSTVVAIIAAIAYGITQDWLIGTIGLIAAGLALGVPRRLSTSTPVTPTWLVTPDLAAEHTAAAQLAPGYSLWPLLFGVRRRHRRRRPGHLPGDLHHRHDPPARRRRRMDGPGLGGAGLGRQRAQRRTCAAAWPTRSSSRSPVPSPSASSSTRSAASCCGCRRPTPSSPSACWRRSSSPSPSCSPTGRRSSHRAMISIDRHRRGRPRRRRRGRGHRRRTRDRPARDHRRTGAARASARTRSDTHADEKASQSVAAIASVAARITLDDDGTLAYDLNGPNPPGDDGTITLPRSSPNNVLFINDSDEHRRLSADMGTILAAGEDGDEVEVSRTRRAPRSSSPAASS